jgi:hypothetical protein
MSATALYYPGDLPLDFIADTCAKISGACCRATATSACITKTAIWPGQLEEAVSGVCIWTSEVGSGGAWVGRGGCDCYCIPGGGGTLPSNTLLIAS